MDMDSDLRLLNDLNAKSEEKLTLFESSIKKMSISLPTDDSFKSSLRHLFMMSDFFSKSCIKNPELLPDLVETNDLFGKYTTSTIRDFVHNICIQTTDEEELGKKLRQLRLREILRIIWRDLTGAADLTETTRDLSDLADALVDESMKFIHRKLEIPYGSPTNKSGKSQTMIVLGMGKLGAFELNLSSDIDLIFAYPDSGNTSGGEKTISNEEFFHKLARKFLELFSVSPEGLLFRVDMRLRPYGENGPIVMSFSAMENYYQIQGRDWERYALIKARVISGSAEDGSRLMQMLKPFIYRRYLDYNTFDSLREMKQSIKVSVEQKGIENNIKLGSGGIREIEFFGQVFQLIRGGVMPDLQERGILNIIQTLCNESYIEPNVRDGLTEAYVFLRNTEHRLQAVDDRQTHNIPVNPIELKRVSVGMGFRDIKSFESELHRHRQTVNNHFNSLLLTPANGNGKTPSTEKSLEGVWLNLIDETSASALLHKTGFKNPAVALATLSNLKESPQIRSLSADGRQRLDLLIPRILLQSGKLDEPDISFSRLIELVKTVMKRSCYISLLLENDQALKHLSNLSCQSPWIISYIAKHPVILDELLDHRTLYSPPLKPELRGDLSRRMDRISDNNLEYQMEELSIFKQVNTLRYAAADISGSLPLMKVSDRLTELAEVILCSVFRISWNHLKKKHGTPSFIPIDTEDDTGFAIVAYGKFGGIELGYRSDLDLVFLHSGRPDSKMSGNTSADTTYFYTRVGQRLIHILSTHTSAGIIYETDMRLRPGGISGMLVSHIDSFEEYQNKTAMPWEHQAIVRARVICGDKYLAKRFGKVRHKTLTMKRDQNELRKNIIEMRQKMRSSHASKDSGVFDIKNDPGGIIDIEFIVQYLVLLHSHNNPDLTRWTDNVRLLEAISDSGIIPEDTSEKLTKSYLKYRNSVHRLNLQNKDTKLSDGSFDSNRSEIICIWKSLIEE